MTPVDIHLDTNQHIYKPELGKVPPGTKVYCGVCGDLCEELRNQTGHRSWTAGISGYPPETFDLFRCPNYYKGWHHQARALIENISRSSSPTLQSFMRQDLLMLLKLRSSTIESFKDNTHVSIVERGLDPADD